MLEENYIAKVLKLEDVIVKKVEEMLEKKEVLKVCALACKTPLALETGFFIALNKMRPDFPQDASLAYYFFSYPNY